MSQCKVYPRSDSIASIYFLPTSFPGLLTFFDIWNVAKKALAQAGRIFDLIGELQFLLCDRKQHGDSSTSITEEREANLLL